MNIIFGSVCSGIEAASVAWNPLGWEASWLAEIEPFPSAALAHHYPDTQNLGDMTKIADKILAKKVAAPDVLVGGTPCQAFSVAGMREGLSDPRGELTIRYVELADAIDNIRQQRGEQPAIIVWENVQGVLSSKDNAFGCFLGALAGESSELQPAGKRWGNAGCVYGPQRAIAWRVLDAQYFGLAQRRKRVFVVASARKGFDPAKVLFEFDCVRRDSAPSREAGKEAADNSGAGSSYAVHNPSGLAQRWPADLASTLNASFGDKLGLEDQHINGGAPLFVLHGTQDPIAGRNSGQENVMYYGTQNDTLREISPKLRAGSGGGTVSQIAGPVKNLVRRLTPIECERLMGFPDSYTQIPWRGKPATECPDGHRYKTLGNSMAVPCMVWIGKRIAKHLSDSEKQQ